MCTEKTREHVKSMSDLFTCNLNCFSDESLKAEADTKRFLHLCTAKQSVLS